MRYFFVLIVALCLASTSNAQVSVRLNFNLDSQPAWGPTGYDYAEFYYLPDIDVYYYVPRHRFYYNQGGRWRFSSQLPSRYRNYDLYNSYKIVVNEREPWRNHENYREKYSSYKGRHDQLPIRDSKESKYFVNKYHPQHNTWVQQQKHDNGNHNGWNKGNNGNGGNKEDKQNNNRDKHDKGKGKR
ncbi:MAG: hypothetical protein M1495_00815 [Bacteroidetes bacterium]|nr:hypothetical protein [Bacteroidota bacterium]